MFASYQPTRNQFSEKREPTILALETEIIMRSYLDKAHSVRLQILDICLLMMRHFVNLFVPLNKRFKSVKGEIVLVTGSGSGLGREIAIEFARRKAIVVLCGRNKDAIEETKKMIEEEDGQAHTYYCDVANRVSVYALAKKIKEEIGIVTILVNNAGILVCEDFLDIPDIKIQKTFEINAMGPVWMCKAFLPDMMERNHGHIVNIASAVSLFGWPKESDYSASKHALKGFNDSLKIELYLAGYTGIKTTLAYPGFFNSGLYQGLEGNRVSGELTVKDVCQRVMSGVLTEEDEIFVLFGGKTAPLLREILPIDVFIRILTLVGCFDVMKNLKAGRVINVGNINNNYNVEGKH